MLYSSVSISFDRTSKAKACMPFKVPTYINHLKASVNSRKMERNKAPQSSAAIVKGSTCAWCTHRIVGRSANQWVDHKSINYWNIKNRIQQDGRSAPIPSVMASLWSGLRLCRLHEVLPSKSSQIVSHLKTNQNTKCCWYHEDLTSDTAGLGKAKLKCFKSSCQKEKSGFDLDFYKPTSIWIW